MVEVKGPGDRLSTKQILWLEYLINIGADAEVCYVKGELRVEFKNSSFIIFKFIFKMHIT